MLAPTLLLALALTCNAYVVSRSALPRQTRRFASCNMAEFQIRGSQANDCIILPHPPYPGEPPEILVGECNLVEREDSTECYTQIYLEPGGTVTFGATDGPPPEDACGLWQCGAKGFQMILTRKFEVTSQNLPDFHYSVSRVYMGAVNRGSDNGRQMIEGRMELYDESKDYTTVDATNAASVNNVWEGEVLNTAVLTTPIGYFSIDCGPAISTDLETEEDEEGK